MPTDVKHLADLTALVKAPDTGLVWFTGAPQMRAFGDLTIRATEAINADPQQSADDFVWYRTGWAEIQDHKDGITLDPTYEGFLHGARPAQVPGEAG